MDKLTNLEIWAINNHAKLLWIAYSDDKLFKLLRENDDFLKMKSQIWVPENKDTEEVTLNRTKDEISDILVVDTLSSKWFYRNLIFDVKRRLFFLEKINEITDKLYVLESEIFNHNTSFWDLIFHSDLLDDALEDTLLFQNDILAEKNFVQNIRDITLDNDGPNGQASIHLISDTNNIDEELCPVLAKVFSALHEDWISIKKTVWKKDYNFIMQFHPDFS